MKKRVIALTLAVVMVSLMLAGCTPAKPTPTGDADGETYPVIRWSYMGGMGNTDETEPLVEEALNKILREKAHAEIDLVPISFFNLQTQLNLLLTGSSDSLDVFSSFWYTDLSSLVANGQVAALDDLLESDGAGIAELFADTPEVLDCCKIDGKLYALPTVAPYSSPMMYVVKKADSDSANIDWSKVHTLDDATQAMLAMKAVNPDHYYIPGAMETYWMPKDVDYLGDSKLLGVLTDPLNSTKVENYYESDYFMNLIKNIKIWQENNIISPDAMSNTNPVLMSVMNGITAGTTGYGWDIEEWCYEASLSGQYDGPMVGAELGERLLTTGNVTTYLYHITSFSKNKEAAMRVLKEMYTNPECANLLGNGIEGLNYVVNEDGSLSYPEGKDSSNSGWGAASYMNPNASLTAVRDSQPADMWDTMRRTNREAKPSLALGFTFNAESVTDQVTACSNVLSQYYMPIMNGEVDIDEVLPLMQKELRDAGIDTIIAEKQRQLDEWLKNK